MIWVRWAAILRLSLELLAKYNRQVTVNGQLVHSLNTNALGLLEFVMQTGVGMTPGLYEVRISDGRRVELGVMVRVDSNAPLRPNTSNAPIIEVPNTINPLHEIYIPIVIR